jgi:hypothetical protein
MPWIPVWDGTVDNRHVVVEKHSNGPELRASTIQKEDAPGTLTHDDGGVVFPSSVWKGDQIEIEGEDKADLERNLVSDGGFSESEAADIIRNLP